MATAIVAAGSAILSWDALSWGAGQLGVDERLTWLYPVVIDGVILVATICALALRQARYRIRAYVWSLLTGAVLASVVGNASHAAGGNPIHVVGAAVPAVALAASLHLLVLLVRHAPAVKVSGEAEAHPERDPDPEPAPLPPEPEVSGQLNRKSERKPRGSRARAETLLTEAAGRGELPSADELAGRLGVSDRQARTYLREHREASGSGSVRLRVVEGRAAQA